MFSLDNVQVFYREATAVRTEIVAYLGGVDAKTSEYSLSGHVTGPLSAHATTMSLRVPFQIRSTSSGALLAVAELSETCFWEPGAPHWYEADVSLVQNGNVVDRCERMVGVRPQLLATDGLHVNGRPGLYRAVAVDALRDEVQTKCVAEQVTAVIDKVSDEELAAASQRGLPLISKVSGTADEVVAELARLSRWPAVVVAIVAASEPLAESLRLYCPNMLLADVARSGSPVGGWAHLAILDEESDIDASSVGVPVIVRVRNASEAPLGRRAEIAGMFEPDAAERACGGQVVGCIV
ncbi:MAG: hypothetical protein KDA63_15965 [Planctomycetales bacterium]|nr:hypothetical protein [Planctomycetales bacterium]